MGLCKRMRTQKDYEDSDPDELDIGEYAQYYTNKALSKRSTQNNTKLKNTKDKKNKNKLKDNIDE